MVILEPLDHRGQFCIAIRGSYSCKVRDWIRSDSCMKYSATHKCFYVRHSGATLQMLRKELGKLDAVELRFDEREMAEMDRRSSIEEKVTLPASYRDHLIKRRYSKSTCENYEAQFKAFLGFIHPKTADLLTDQDIHDYQLYLVQERKVGPSTQNQAINAIKFYLEQVKGGERREYYIERPKKETKLPTVLSEEEIHALLSQTHYVKHKCMLLLLYSAGLRVSELLGLRDRDLDRDRKLIHVRSGKGKKDRVTLLSPIVIQYVDEYLSLLKPKHWLFEGPDGGPYSATSINVIIKRSAAKAGIAKRVSAHTLRHSFATHLLEHGTDLRYIQSLLGHENSKTTERYTQVTKKGFENLVSPLDRIAAGSGNKGI